MKSHPLRMRGLKHMQYNNARKEGRVASFADAWIETFDPSNYFGENFCRILCGCVD